jgi:hypothetical protein
VEVDFLIEDKERLFLYLDAKSGKESIWGVLGEGGVEILLDKSCFAYPRVTDQDQVYLGLHYIL